jgi:hypothetical protein
MKTRLCLVLLGACLLRAAQPAEPMKVAIVGLDSSHCVVFSKLMNDAKNPDHVPGAGIVKAFPGGSPDIESSRSRIDGFIKQMGPLGVKVAGSIAEAVAGVDAVLIHSVDGRAHLPQFREVVAALPGKPVFVDKPLGGSLREGAEILRLARQTGTPMFTASGLRFVPSLQSIKVGALRTIVGYSPASTEEHHPDLFWYGIHGVEIVYRALGRGCSTVARTHTANTDVVTGVWSDGRTGIMLGYRNPGGGFGYKIIGDKGTAGEDIKFTYVWLVREVVKFFQTRQPPVTPAESLEVLAFMEAADLSKKQGGKPVSVSDLLAPYADLLAP